MTSLFVQFRPVAAFAAWRQALRQPAVRQFLVGRVNPTETQGFFYNLNISESVPPRAVLTEYNDPALLFDGMIGFQPLPQLAAVFKFKQIDNFHYCSIRIARLKVACLSFGHWFSRYHSFSTTSTAPAMYSTSAPIDSAPRRASFNKVAVFLFIRGEPLIITIFFAIKRTILLLMLPQSTPFF